MLYCLVLLKHWDWEFEFHLGPRCMSLSFVCLYCHIEALQWNITASKEFCQLSAEEFHNKNKSGMWSHAVWQICTTVPDCRLQIPEDIHLLSHWYENIKSYMMNKGHEVVGRRLHWLVASERRSTYKKFLCCPYHWKGYLKP